MLLRNSVATNAHISVNHFCVKGMHFDKTIPNIPTKGIHGHLVSPSPSMVILFVSPKDVLLRITLPTKSVLLRNSVAMNAHINVNLAGPFPS